MTRTTVRREFDAARFRLSHLEAFLREARDAGLADDSMVGFNTWYARGWRVEVLVNGEQDPRRVGEGERRVVPPHV